MTCPVVSGPTQVGDRGSHDTGILGGSRGPGPACAGSRRGSLIRARKAADFSVPYLVLRIPPVAGWRLPAPGAAKGHKPPERTITLAHASEPAKHTSFTRAELRSFTGGTLPDLIAEGVRLLFAGINPGLRSVAVQGHFAPRGNRFYPALLRAGITDHLIDASAGLSASDRDYLLGRGVGITSLVARATASAGELGPAELAEGAQALADRVRRYRPRVVAILGITAYRTAFGSPRAVLGRQPGSLNGAQVWVVPNPSGRNAHASADTLAAAYREVALAAAIDLSPA